MGTDIFRQIERKIAEQLETKVPLLTNEEGSFSPELDKSGEVLTLINEAIKAVGYEEKVKIALDVAASSFYKNGEEKIGLYIWGKVKKSSMFN